MLFRQIHFLVDVIQDQIQDPSLWKLSQLSIELSDSLVRPDRAVSRFRRVGMPPRPCSRAPRELLWHLINGLFLGSIKVSLIASACLAWHDAALTKARSRHARRDPP